MFLIRNYKNAAFAKEMQLVNFRHTFQELIPRLTDYLNNKVQGRAWWFIPVTPSFWEAEAGKASEVRSSRPTWPTTETLFPLKTQKSAGHGGASL